MAGVFLRFLKFSQHPTCKDHAILHGKPFGIPLILSRGNLHQLKSHYRRHYLENGEACDRMSKTDFHDAVLTNHVSVPSKKRCLANNGVQKGAVSRKDGTSNVFYNREEKSNNARVEPEAREQSTPNPVQITETNENSIYILTEEQEFTSPTPPVSSTAASFYNAPISTTVYTTVESGECFLQTGMHNFVQTPTSDDQKRMIEMLEKLLRKVDKLTNEPKTALAPSTSKDVENEMSQRYHKMKQWHDVKKLMELVAEVDDLSLYPMNTEEIGDFKEGGAILHCETCFTLYHDTAKKLTPAQAAKN